MTRRGVGIGGNTCWLYLLLHNLDVDLLHIDFLIELGRKLGSSQELCIHATGHLGRRWIETEVLLGYDLATQVCSWVCVRIYVGKRPGEWYEWRRYDTIRHDTIRYQCWWERWEKLRIDMDRYGNIICMEHSNCWGEGSEKWRLDLWLTGEMKF